MARPGLDKHVKFRRLVRMLNEPMPHVRGYLECLWEVGYENGDAFIGDADAVEAAAHYPGEPGKLFAALRDCGGSGRSGFIEATDHPNEYRIHDLMDHAPDYVKKRRQRENERKSNNIGENGGQRQTSADSGGKRQASRTLLPAPAPAPSTRTPAKQQAGAFAEITEDDLDKPAKVEAWIRRQRSKPTPVIPDNEDARLMVHAAAVKSRSDEANADKPIALFAWLVSDPENWKQIPERDVAEASRRMASLSRAPPSADVPRPKFKKPEPNPT